MRSRGKFQLRMRLTPYMVMNGIVRSLWKRWWLGLLVVFAPALYWHEELIIYAFDMHTMGSGEPVIIGLPSGMPDHSPRPSYTGPHPTDKARPDDPFPYPIRLGEVGPIESLYEGPPQYPWICNVEKSGLTQPLVDNQDRIGIAIYEKNSLGEKTNKIKGYSKDCLIPTQAWYFYNKAGTREFFPLEQADNDIATLSLDGKQVDFIVRVEVGVINRYLYSLSVLKGPSGELDKPDGRHWNKKLIYQFRGGIGIGYKQGKTRPKYMLKRRYDALSKGYAVAYSSGNQTSNTYNILLAEDTAVRVKRQFTSLYGKPKFTIGIGGSGGAIQQYLIGQNGSDLIDGGIALYSFPDMLTQTIYALDCELLEYYFDVSSQDDRWHTWEERPLIEGLNAASKENGFNILHQLALAFNGKWPFRQEGMSECSSGWRGAAQIANNPRYFHYYRHFNEQTFNRIHWTIWEDQKHIFGVGDDGYALQTWDNIGVQYGLNAMINGQISVETFLDLNSQIGGWKAAREMQPARYWLYFGIRSSIFDVSPWSQHNMNLSPDKGQTPAQRTEGNLGAIGAAYRSGNVFVGKLNIPIIDLRHYNDPHIDMHHSFASFETRLRLLQGQGHAKNQVIWITTKPHEPKPMAIEAMDRWLTANQEQPSQIPWENRPEDIEDACFDEHGELVARGPKVWDGGWNNQKEGACMQLYPNFKSSREIAGSPVSGSIFKCHLQSIEQAKKKGVYGNADIGAYLERMQEIFPDGVCDYTQGDLGRPEEL